jgi:hypothetical protein
MQEEDFPAWSATLSQALFDENAFTQLVAPYEGLRGAELFEELLYLAVLIYVLRLN